MLTGTLKVYSDFPSWRAGRHWFLELGQTTVRFKKIHVPPLPSWVSMPRRVLLSFAAVRLPKRWWRRAPKSRGSLRRCTGEWGTFRAPGGLWDGQRDLNSGFAKSSVTGKSVRAPAARPYVVFTPGSRHGSLPVAEISLRQIWLGHGVSTAGLHFVICSVESHWLGLPLSITWLGRMCVKQGGVISWLSPLSASWNCPLFLCSWDVAGFRQPRSF